MIVEVTPLWRVAMQKKGIDWRTEALQSTLVGHQVTFRGRLIFDNAHAGESVKTAPGNPTDGRKTAWNVHPIAAMQVGP